MGGFGSGRKLFKKQTVEDAICIDANWMATEKILQEGNFNDGGLSWFYEGEAPFCSVNYEAHCNLPDPFLRLHYIVDESERVDFKVFLKKIPAKFGGVHWYFICPSNGCDRLAIKLYIIVGLKYFVCRKCANLTYKSCQESHRFKYLI
jgi:hypothetical protein